MSTSPVLTEPTDAECELLQRLRATPEIFELMTDGRAPELSVQKTLRARFDDDLVRMALAVADARKKARGQLPHADQLWLTRVGLEQCTAWDVAQHKAQRFHSSSQVYDLCCGIGVDASHLAALTSTIAMDTSPAMCLRTAWNADIWQPSPRLQTECRDITTVDWTGKIVHVDPDRRAGGDRPTKRLELYQPDLSWMQNLTRTAAGGAIKISPASNFLQKFPGCEIELISLQGECREATVWFGSLAGPYTFRATSLPSGESVSADPLSAWTNTTETVGAFLLDPDPAIVRSGLLDVMAEQHGLLRLDAEEEYLTADAVPSTSFVTAFQVECVLPYNLKELKRYLRNSPSRHYEIKCRRIPTDADAMRRQLPTGDGEPRVIVIVRCGKRSHIVVTRRLQSAT
jgi:hypothetical protein